MPRLVLISIALGLLSLGCGGSSTSSNPESELLAAVERHLAKRTDLDMSSMELSVARADIQGDRAQAEIDFRSTGSAEAAMSMTYDLRRTADGWEVEPKAAPSGHGMPQTTPPPAGGLPPDHPPLEGGEQQPPLPPGHPPVE